MVAAVLFMTSRMANVAEAPACTSNAVLPSKLHNDAQKSCSNTRQVHEASSATSWLSHAGGDLQ